MVKSLRLEGVDGSSWRLWVPGSRRLNEVALAQLPDLMGWPVQQTFNTLTGVRGGVWNGAIIPEREFSLECRVEGSDTFRVVADFLAALGDGEGEATLVASSEELGEWQGRVLLQNISEVSWWGDPANPHGADFEVGLAMGNPAWQGPGSGVSFTPNGITGEDLIIPVGGGNLPVWPMFTITGGTSNHVTRLGFNDGPRIELPWREDGWRVVTDPFRRSLTGATGGPQAVFPGPQPHWPAPPRLERNVLGQRFFRINADPMPPSATYQLIVSFTPERTRPW